jgi:putative membrane protein
MGKIIVRFIKGFVIGAAMLIPGVSGGTIAIILGIYDELIVATSNIRKSFRRNILILINYMLGGLGGIFLLARPMLALVEWKPQPTMFFFIGAIIGSIPALYKRVIYAEPAKASVIRFEGLEIEGSPPAKRHIGPVHVLIALVGAAIGYGLEFIPANLVSVSGGFSLKNGIVLFVAGLIVAIAIILPGISASYLLLVFGLYESTLQAFRGLTDFTGGAPVNSIAYLLSLGLGAIVGTFGIAKLMEKLMYNYPRFTFMLIIGFMLGSIIPIFPGLPAGVDIPVSIITFVVGAAVVMFIVSFDRKAKS